jgi:hypothetical protein
MQYSVAALLGTVYAGSAGPLPNAAFPKFETPVTIAAGDLDAENVQPAWSMNTATTPANVGPIRGYRNDLFVYPIQNLAAADTTNNHGLIQA